MNQNNTNVTLQQQEVDVTAQNEEMPEQSEYQDQWSFDSTDSQQPEGEEKYNWNFETLETEVEAKNSSDELDNAPEYDFTVFASESQQPENSETLEKNPLVGNGENQSQQEGNPFAGGDGAPSGFGNPLAPAEGYDYDFSNVAGEGESGMQTPWDELLQFEEFDDVGDILGLEENPFAGGNQAEGEGNPFAGGSNIAEGSFMNTGDFSQDVDTGVDNSENGNGNNFVGDSEGETGSNNQADGNGNWYFGNENQTNGNGNWYISQESDLPNNFLGEESNSFVSNLFGDNGNSLGGNNPAFAGGGLPSFASGNIDFSETTGADGNQTEGNGNWYFGEGNNTNGNGNWEFGNNNQTEGNANWNLGDGNSITGNGNQPNGDGNMITGNGNQPRGDDNQINGNRVSQEEDNQNIVGNGDRYLLMDNEGNVFVVNNESASDSQYQFDFEFLTNTNGEESATTSLEQPFVEELFTQFAGGNNLSMNNTEASESQNFSSVSGGGNPFGGNVSNFASNSETDNNNDSENQDSDLDEQLRQSPFGRLFDLPGVDGAEDIFGNLGAPSGEGGGIGEGSPFAFWDPVTEGNPFTPDDDLPANENLGGGNPFGGGNPSEGESMQSPWDALLQFEEFDSVEDILGISTGNNSGGGENNQETGQFEELETEVFSNLGSEEDFDFDNPMGEEFSETPIADLLNFPGVDSPEAIFSTFGIGDDANGENLLENWNPYTDGNPFVVGDEDESEPVYNANGDRLLLENQFGYLIQDSEDRLFLSVNDLIDENDLEINQNQGGFPDDLFSSNDNDGDLPANDFNVGNLFLEGQEIAIEIEDGYLLNDESGNWFISSDDGLSEEDISLGSIDLFSESNPFAEEIASFLS